MAIILNHQWPMKSNLQKENGLDVLFKSTSHQVVWKCDLNLPNICFRLSIWPNGHREALKLLFESEIPRTNETTELIVLHTRRLFGPGSTWTSSPKMVPTPLILFGKNTPCSVAPRGFGCAKNPSRSGAATSSAGQGTVVRLLNLTRLNDLFLRSSFDLPKGH